MKLWCFLCFNEEEKEDNLVEAITMKEGDIFGNDVVSAVLEEGGKQEGDENDEQRLLGAPVAGGDEQLMYFEEMVRAIPVAGSSFGSWHGPPRSEGESSSGSALAAAATGSESHKRPKVYADFKFFMENWRCNRLCDYFLIGTSFALFFGSCFLSSEVVDSPIKKFMMQSYYDRYTNLHDPDFENFLSEDVAVGFCETHPDSHNLVPRLSDLNRDLIGEGSHRRVSTLIKFQTQQSKTSPELLSSSCEFIIIERLPSGVFADPFELQRLVQRGVFNGIAVFGDTNLELPSFLSNRSAVEIHLGVDPNILVEPTDINIELPLHARYQPLNESGYSMIKFGLPDVFMRCSLKEKLENRHCFFRLTNDEANDMYADAGIVWRIPSGKKAHSDIVYAVTFIAALLSTLVIVITSLHHSNTRLNLKQS